MVNGVTDARHQLEDLPLAELPLAHMLIERAPLDVLHRKVGPPRMADLSRAGLVDLRNAPMIELTQHVHLVLEAPEHVP